MTEPAAVPLASAPSLRRQLTFWLLSPMVLLWLVNAWVVYQTAVESSNRAHDRALQGSLLAIAERISLADQSVTVDLPYSALEMLESELRSRVYYRVTRGGESVTGYDDLPPPPRVAEPGKPFFYDADYRGEEVRVAALLRPLYGETTQSTVLVQVAETTELRKTLLDRILVQSVLEELLLIVLAACAVWLALNRGLRSLNAVREQVGRREPSDLQPIDARLVPSELRPLIDAINTHTARLTRMIGLQRQFVADAAHQLKTPLALLRSQADFAGRQRDPAATGEALDALRRSLSDTAHVVDQLLALNRAEAADAPRMERLDLRSLARDTTFDCLPRALAKPVELAFEGEQPALIVGHALLLQELLKNLIDNAIRFTPAAGQVTVAVDAAADRVLLSVVDSGPGIAAEHRERVFDRFFQIPGSTSGGCGLGLAIVDEIAALHRAHITLAPASDGAPPGLRVRVSFAAAAESAPAA